MWRRLAVMVVTGCCLSDTALSDVDIGRADQNKNKLIEVGSETDILVLHREHPVLAACDKDNSGTVSNQSELDCANAWWKSKARRARLDAQNANPERKPLTYDQARTLYGKPKDTDIELPFYIRDAYTPGAVSRKPLKPQTDAGALFSYTRQYTTNEDIYSATGAVMVPIRLGPSEQHIVGVPRIGDAVFLPGIEFNRVSRSKDKSKEVNYLGLFGTGEAALMYWPVFPTQLVRAGGYLKTDFNFDTRIPGAFIEWQPYFLEYGISAPHTIPGTNLAYQITPVVRAEVERVVKVGTSPGVVEGQDYLRAGPVVDVKFWFEDGFLSSLAFHFKYWKMWDVTRAAPGTGREFIQGDVVYLLDPKGHFGLNLRYRRGDEPGLGMFVHDLMLGFSAKY